MKTPILISALIAINCLVIFGSRQQFAASPQSNNPQTGTLCEKGERVIFSCPVKRPAKIVSLCASKDLAADRGYIQYRFGLPGKIELEYPKDRSATQAKFQYSHYFRAQFDLTEISFTINGYEYQITDDYNGEEKPAQSVQAVSVTAPGKPKEVQLRLPHEAKSGLHGFAGRAGERAMINGGTSVPVII